MRKFFYIGLLLCAVQLSAAEAVVPDTPAGRLRVCGQNMQNYYIHYDNYQSTRANYNAAQFAAKTMKIVNGFLTINADIYAVCEVEACELVLTQLADSLNKYAGELVYAAAPDGINEAWDPEYDNNLKSGFIYRTDKLKPYRSNYYASSWSYYKNTMRIQAFEELGTGERLVISMNHFKAKTGTGDKGESTRQSNAQHLLSTLKKLSLGDPDILIMGDMNCEVGEEPLNMIEKEGYTEQLIRFDENAYSHCYGGGELIDHVYANSTMEQQIVSTKVYHICTKCNGYNNSSSSYSDHDPYVVDINLGQYNQGTGDVESREPSSENRKLLINGHLYILVSGEMYDIMGNKVQK